MGFGLDARLPASSVRRLGGWAAERLSGSRALGLWVGVSVRHLGFSGQAAAYYISLAARQVASLPSGAIYFSHECRFSGFFLTAS